MKKKFPFYSHAIFCTARVPFLHVLIVSCYILQGSGQHSTSGKQSKNPETLKPVISFAQLNLYEDYSFCSFIGIGAVLLHILVLGTGL